LTVQQDEIKTGKYTVDEIFDFVEKEGDKYLNFKGSVGWSESTLNKGVLATRGHSQSLVFESTLPGSDLSFFKLDYRAQYFHPITDNYTLRLHTELGYGDGYGSTSGLPFYENYYAGGFNSVRGFKDSTLGPRSTPSNGSKPGTLADPDQDPLPFGGNALVQGGVEVMFPLPFVKDQRSLRTSVFWDVGNVFDTNCDSSRKTASGKNVECNNIDLSGMASSVGIGVTWITALGPLSFALAMPIKKPDDEAETQVFQFSLGQTF
ncbi:BamA/TamA family outer membrane protein, partial [Pseudomonas amygdali]